MSKRLPFSNTLLAIAVALMVAFAGLAGLWASPAFAAVQAGSLGAAGAGTYKVSVEVKYGQTEARSMLKMVNDFRTGSDAWAWDSSNTKKERYSGLGKLTYDYELERVAKLRAAEIALRFSHSRPNGDADPWSAYSGGNYKGENIAAGYSSAASVFAGWQETNEDYAGQGHRRNMLGSNFTAIGIGHVVYNGRHYWVQEFCAPTLSTSATAAADSISTVSLDVSSSVVTSRITTPSPTSIKVELGESVTLPSVSARIGLVDMWPSGTAPVKVSTPSWSCGDTSVASVSNGKVIARKVGKTTLSANVSLVGSTAKVSVPVEVVGKSIASASVLAIADKTYTGSAIKPKPTVKLGSNELVEGADYTLGYKNNVNAGTATVTVTGRGSYAGTKTATFKINPASLAKATLALAKTGYTYTGSTIKPAAKSVTLGSKTLSAKADYTVSYSSNKNAGTAKVTVTGRGNYKGSVSKSFTIAKAANPMSVSGKAATVSYGKKAQAVKASVAYGFSKKAAGAVTYARVAKGSSKWLSAVNKKTGAITVKAGAPRGKTYTVNVKVSAAGNANYKSASKTIAVRVKVK